MPVIDSAAMSMNIYNILGHKAITGQGKKGV